MLCVCMYLNVRMLVESTLCVLPQMPHAVSGRGAVGGVAAAQEAAVERGVLLFKLLGNLHAPSDDIPDVRCQCVLQQVHICFCNSIVV